MSIQNELDKIKGINQAMYGSEVRLAIHDALLKVYDDAAKSGNANMEVSLARGNYPTLRERLQEVDNKQATTTSQLALKPSLSDVRLKAESIRLNDVDEDFISALSGDATFNLESIPRDKSVTEVKTTFIDISTNLFNKDDVTFNKTIDSETGDIIDSETNVVSGKITIEPEADYTITGGSVRLTQYDKDDTMVATNVTSFSIGELTLTTHSDTSYGIISSGWSRLALIQLNKGEDSLPYEPYRKPSLKVATDNGIFEESLEESRYKTPPEKTTFFKTTTNLFNKDDVMLKKMIDSETGDIIDSETNVVSGKIPIEPETDYTITGGSVRLTQYDKDDTMVATNVTSWTIGELTLTTHSDVSYGRITTGEGRRASTQLNVGNLSLPYEDYHEPYIPREYLDKTPEHTVHSKPYYLAPNSPAGTIDPTDTVEPLDESVFSVENVYGWYDDLMALYPNYITREQIGIDESGEFPIYVYSFDANNMLETPYTSTYKPKPKLILGTGMHGRTNMGDPTNAIFSLYWLMKDICEQNQSSEWFSYLRNNITFKIIPLQNPWGVNQPNRKNSNGVDINRNFDTPTWRSGEPNAADYGGIEPFSESESRALRDYILANQDAQLVMDFHTVGTLYEHEKWMYFEFPTGSELFNIANTHVKTMSSKWKAKDYPLDDSEYYGYVYNTLAGKYQEWVNLQGIPSAVLEGAPHIPDTDEPRDSQTIMDMYYDSMSNWVGHFVKHL